MSNFQTLPVKEYNAKNIGANMKFQNADGSFKKTGHVVFTNEEAKYFKTLKEAAVFIANGAVFSGYQGGRTNESMMND